jgi:hypothetical protein
MPQRNERDSPGFEHTEALSGREGVGGGGHGFDCNTATTDVRREAVAGEDLNPCARGITPQCYLVVFVGEDHERSVVAIRIYIGEG